MSTRERFLVVDSKSVPSFVCVKSNNNINPTSICIHRSNQKAFDAQQWQSPSQAKRQPNTSVVKQLFPPVSSATPSSNPNLPAATTSKTSPCSLQSDFSHFSCWLCWPLRQSPGNLSIKMTPECARTRVRTPRKRSSLSASASQW
jgi:hypothetical protein